jgi:hypothetical protein
MYPFSAFGLLFNPEDGGSSLKCWYLPWCHIQEDHNLNIQCHDNLKFHKNKIETLQTYTLLEHMLPQFLISVLMYVMFVFVLVFSNPSSGLVVPGDLKPPIPI